MRRYGAYVVTGFYKRVNYTDIETTSGAMRSLTVVRGESPAVYGCLLPITQIR